MVTKEELLAGELRWQQEENVRLRAETATLRQALLEAAADVDARAAENERLRAALERVKREGGTMTAWRIADEALDRDKAR